MSTRRQESKHILGGRGWVIHSEEAFVGVVGTSNNFMRFLSDLSQTKTIENSQIRKVLMNIISKFEVIPVGCVIFIVFSFRMIL